MSQAIARRGVFGAMAGFLSAAVAPFQKLMSPPSGWRFPGWWPIVHEPFTGAWQRNLSCAVEDVLSFSTVWACVRLISSDISKIDMGLVKRSADDIWLPYENTAHSPVLAEPNHFQTPIQFFESWILSKLIHGNTYVLKEREPVRKLVTRLYVLDAMRVQPLIADDGQIFYQLSTDNLSGITGDTQIKVPASEIIHDRMTPAYHPLIGISPIRACALTAMQGLKIQNMSSAFFENHAQPSGVLTAAQTLSPEQAAEIQQQWQAGFTGVNQGKVAVLGADLKYQAITIDPHDAQLVEQLKMTGEIICSCFGVPPYMVGVGPTPPYNNVQALQIQYYTQCLQVLIESIEALLARGMELPSELGIEFDEDSFLRMDTATKMQVAKDAVSSGTMSPNEARKRFHGLGPVRGGDSPYLQQQNFSLEALAKRDAQADPFARDTPNQALPDPSPAPDGERSLMDFGIEKAIEVGMVRTHAIAS